MRSAATWRWWPNWNWTEMSERTVVGPTKTDTSPIINHNRIHHGACMERVAACVLWLIILNYISGKRWANVCVTASFPRIEENLWTVDVCCGYTTGKRAVPISSISIFVLENIEKWSYISSKLSRICEEFLT